MKTMYAKFPVQRSKLRVPTSTQIKYFPNIVQQVAEKFKHSDYFIAKKHFHRFFNTGVGIEVEVENVPADFVAPVGWRATKDASLRNNGMEFVTMFGMRLYDVPDLLVKLFRRMASFDQEFFKFSERTSIHVHLDIRKLTESEVKSLVLLYTVFEDMLFDFAGSLRKHNIFCVPLRYISLSTLPKNDLVSFIRSWEKYCAINFTRLQDYGTVEFRHMEGTNNPETIFIWIVILNLLVDYVRTHDCDSICDELKELKFSSHYDNFMTKVFGPFSNKLMLVAENFDRAVSDAKLLFDLRV